MLIGRSAHVVRGNVSLDIDSPAAAAFTAGLWLNLSIFDQNRLSGTAVGPPHHVSASTRILIPGMISADGPIGSNPSTG